MKEKCQNCIKKAVIKCQNKFGWSWYCLEHAKTHLDLIIGMQYTDHCFTVISVKGITKDR